MNTPAPWTVSELDASGEVSAYHIFIEPNVAVIERKVDGKDQHDMADAHLIAAAPAMLEALEDMLAYAPEPADYSTAQVHENARAVIRAAKGEA